MLVAPTTRAIGSEVEVGTNLVVRVPTTEDLLAVQAPGTRGEARLLERCIVRDVGEIERRTAFETLARDRPILEVLIDLACASCEHVWSERFATGEYLWLEVRAQARRLLLDIHTLASSYGWREDDVLTMSTT